MGLNLAQAREQHVKEQLRQQGSKGNPYTEYIEETARKIMNNPDKRESYIKDDTGNVDFTPLARRVLKNLPKISTTREKPGQRSVKNHLKLIHATNPL
ncbi:MAG: hypothetical protein HQL68_06555 [Magnetococcales bacterium]|nr:hypothetical protein [Magnetococcales bacterium]